MRLAMASTPPGTVYVSANMGTFSPNPVPVGNSATASLSANYTPPSGVPEGNLTAAYDWTITQVQYKALQADAFGTPPSGSYTDSISPQQPSAQSGALLTFTPNIAGYWQVSVECGVFVLDLKNDETWTGSGSAGPQNLASYELTPEAKTPSANGSSLNVCVGETIDVGLNDDAPSDMTLQWAVQGAPIESWGPKANQTMQQSAVIYPLTASDLTQNNLQFYWMDTDSGSSQNEKVSVAGTLGNGQRVPPKSLTFNVFRPVATMQAAYPGAIALDNPYQYSPSEELYDGEDPSNGVWGVAIEFEVPPSVFGNDYNLETAQIALGLSVITVQYDAITQKTYTFAFTLPSSMLPGPLLDTQFPFEVNGANGTNYDQSQTYLEVYDAPDYPAYPLPAGNGFGPGDWSTYDVEVTENFAQMLLFKPSGAYGQYSGTDAPLEEVGWGWTADAANPNNSGFYLASSAKIPTVPPTTGIDLAKLPEWNNNAEDPSHGWNNPNWTLDP